MSLQEPTSAQVSMVITSVGDHELDMMQFASRVIEQLDPDARERLVGWLCRRFCIPVSW